MKKLIIILLLFPLFDANAESDKLLPDLVQLNAPYNATMEVVKKSDVHIYLPHGSVATISLDGSAKFDTATSHTVYLSTEIHKSGKSVLVKSKVKSGNAFSIGLVTTCGETVSVTIHGLANSVDPLLIKPRLHIASANCIN